MADSSVQHVCLQCDSRIDASVFQFAVRKYKFPLCEDCQIWFVGKVFHTTRETIQLYFALKHKGIPVQLEKHLGHKRVAIVVREAKVQIEVEVSHTPGNIDHILKDLKSVGLTGQPAESILKIPETLVKYNIEETSDLIQKRIMDQLYRLQSPAPRQ